MSMAITPVNRCDMKIDHYTCDIVLAKAGMKIHPLSQKVQLYKSSCDMAGQRKLSKAKRKAYAAKAETYLTELELLTI